MALLLTLRSGALPRLSILQSYRRTPIGVGIVSRYMTSDRKLSNDIQGLSIKHSVPNGDAQTPVDSPRTVPKNEDLQVPPTRSELKNGMLPPPGAPPPQKYNLWEKINWPIGKSIAGAILTAMIGYLKALWDSKSKERAIDNMMENGTKPCPLVENPIERNDIVERIKNTFILGQGTEKKFGVILGPTGTGKTHVIREAHRWHPKGSLYFETDGVPLFAKELAEATGIRIEPTLLSVVLSKFFPSSPGYYPLPSDFIDSMVSVIRILAQRAAVFKEKHGRSPCLFIDAVDLLAKDNHAAFVKLVEIAKKLANDGNLRIIFGCSEGHVMPLVHGTSSKTRVHVMEVLDIPEEKAVDYLMDKGLPKDFADRVTKEVGCRMIFLDHVVSFYHFYKSQYSADDDLLKKIKDKCHFLFTKQGYSEIVRQKPRSAIIIKHLVKFDRATGFDPEVFLDEYSDEAVRGSMEDSLQLLVSSNALRYTEEGQVTWHSKMMEEKVKKEFKLK
ncbi:PREDICTED: uncharacterized protein LOC109581991 [Amphimedon queenslandica]|uniref:ORC1/DEAH AAA+ ATPase domain-containing protein n=1 Tax=Amphimedon queenslandica TaxID=400682 RepID=A0A1X7UWD5_AMPQE|nr:PREDICTED: uncharacterized protein LOC109581991 [Amphimedon queenslandica]|eukprot:XP_019852082.1 PREDICTED: uncharacterized protein LOC109581991 [Amphimedon queenslandica]